jgi:hypothetical protein
MKHPGKVSFRNTIKHCRQSEKVLNLAESQLSVITVQAFPAALELKTLLTFLHIKLQH